VKPSREFLGNDYSYFVRRKVFLLVDALETDEYLFIRIERTRVYFDDVLAVTIHRQRGIGALVATGLVSFLFGILAIGNVVESSGEKLVAGFIFLFIAALFGAVMILRLVMPVDIICVFGRRTNSRMKFWLRKGRAQEI